LSVDITKINTAHATAGAHAWKRTAREDAAAGGSIRREGTEAATAWGGTMPALGPYIASSINHEAVSAFARVQATIEEQIQYREVTDESAGSNLHCVRDASAL